MTLQKTIFRHILTMGGPSDQIAKFYASDYDNSVIVVDDGVRDEKRYEDLVSAIEAYGEEGYDYEVASDEKIEVEIEAWNE